MRPTLLAVRTLLALAATLPAASPLGSTASASSFTTSPSANTANGPGMYHLYSCRTPTGARAPLDGWTGFRDQSCVSGGSFQVSTDETSGGNWMQWAPAPGLRGVSMELWRTASAWVASAPARAEVQLNVISGFTGADGLPDNTTKYYESLVATDAKGISVGTGSDPWSPANYVRIDPLPTKNQNLPFAEPVSLAALCPTAWEDGLRCTAQIAVYAADVRMMDAQAPTSSNPGGTLASALRSPSSVSAGSLDFTLHAADIGSGVLQALLEIDGKVVSTAPSVPRETLCSPSSASDGLRGYLAQVPCPLTAQASGTWDTTTVSDGVHSVRLLIEDAAGNTTVAIDGKVLVSNKVPGAERPRDEATGGAAGVNGVPSATGKLTLDWPQTAREPSRRRSVVKRCAVATYASKHPLDCEGRPAVSTLEQPWSATTSNRLRLRLTTAAGVPVVGARVRLIAQSTAVGAAPAELPVLITGGDGVAEVMVPRASGSRTFTAKWFAQVADVLPTAETSATLDIGASTSFAAPSRVGPSAEVKFSGKLRGPAGMLGAVPITLQVFNQGRWKTFETATSDAAGKWSARIQFAPRRGIYPVRVKVGKSPTFPFVPGVAAQSRVRVS